METVNHILIPTDFSPCAEGAVEYGLLLARQAGASVHVMHVVCPGAGCGEERAAFRAIRRTLQMNDTDGLTANGFVVQGAEVAARIAEVAVAVRAGLLVMGTHGRRGIKHALLGSIAEEVVRTAPVSVLTVRGSVQGGVPRRVMAAVDFSSCAPAVLHQAYHVARTCGAALDVVHVIEPMAFPVSLTGIATVYDLIPDYARKVRDRLDALVQAALPREGAVAIHLEDGHPFMALAAFAEKHEAGLIVAGTHGLKGVPLYFLGSVAERLVRRAPCPVLIAKAAEWAGPAAPRLTSTEASAG
jgi:nucleotide-binding universal stress UspA family protein